MMRDLCKDLELCIRVAPYGSWKWKPINVGGTTPVYTYGNAEKANTIAEFIAESFQGWPEAIRRALEAEARVKELEAEVERLKEQLKELVK